MAAVLAAVVATALLTPSAVAQTTVSIPDDNLRAAINEALGRASDSTDAITADQMASITRLIAPDRGITDLTGLSHATNLVELDLTNNRGIGGVLDISGFEALEVLKAGETDITSVTFASADESSLKELYLRDFRSPNESFTGTLDVSTQHNLEKLSVVSTGITALTLPALNSSLTHLDLFDNEDYTGPLDVSVEVNLVSLRAVGSAFTVLRLNNLPNLKTIDVRHNDISSIVGLTGTSFGQDNLEYLYLTGNNLSGTLNVSSYTKLKELKAGNNNYDEVILRNNDDTLERLSIADNSITRIENIARATRLEQFDARNNNLTTVNLPTVSHGHTYGDRPLTSRLHIWLSGNNSLEEVNNQAWDIPTWTAANGWEAGVATTFYGDPDGYFGDRLYNADPDDSDDPGDLISGTARVTEGPPGPGGV